MASFWADECDIMEVSSVHRPGPILKAFNKEYGPLDLDYYQKMRDEKAHQEQEQDDEEEGYEDHGEEDGLCETNRSRKSISSIDATSSKSKRSTSAKTHHFKTLERLGSKSKLLLMELFTPSSTMQFYVSAQTHLQPTIRSTSMSWITRMS